MSDAGIRLDPIYVETAAADNNTVKNLLTAPASVDCYRLHGWRIRKIGNSAGKVIRLKWSVSGKVIEYVNMQDVNLAAQLVTVSLRGFQQGQPGETITYQVVDGGTGPSTGAADVEIFADISRVNAS